MKIFQNNSFLYLLLGGFIFLNLGACTNNRGQQTLKINQLKSKLDRIDASIQDDLTELDNEQMRKKEESERYKRYMLEDMEAQRRSYQRVLEQQQRNYLESMRIANDSVKNILNYRVQPLDTDNEKVICKTRSNPLSVNREIETVCERDGF